MLQAVSVSDTSAQTGLQIVEPLPLLSQPAAGMLALQPLNRPVQLLATGVNGFPSNLAQVLRRLADKLPAGEKPFGDDLSSGARSCGPKVSNKITDSEIDLVPHGGD